jgi:hypothetical protein
VDRREQNYRERTSPNRLLILQVFIAGDEDLEAFRSEQFEEFAVFDTAPTQPSDGAYLVARELSHQWMRHVLIKQHPHD